MDPTGPDGGAQDQEQDQEIEQLSGELEENWTASGADRLASHLTNRGGRRSNVGAYAAAMLDLDRAVAVFDRLLKIDGLREVEPKLVIARVNRGITLSNQGAVKQGLEDFEAAADISKRLVEVDGKEEVRQLWRLAAENRDRALEQLQGAFGGAGGAGGGGHGSGAGGPTYDPKAVAPMREELTRVGVRELLTPADVDEVLEKNSGTVLVVVNSVCGCAAGGARPGVMLALQNKSIPDHATTVFAGMEREAVARARSFFKDYPPSSPAIALFKDGQLVCMQQRQDIEGRAPQEIARVLVQQFDEHCTRSGPSIPAEEFQKLTTSPGCGSSVPRFGEQGGEG